MACCGDSEEVASSPVDLVRRQASGPHQQGYDYDFIPTLEAKYECSICLLCQREPAQTTCGHRFCRDCILTWIRTERQRCPEDNSPITEQDVFPDNFAKREILGLNARCPNSRSGCPAVVEVGQMEEHQRQCSYRSTPCPNGCTDVLLQQDVEEHVNRECLFREIDCSLCYAKFPLNQQQAHFEMCPMVSLPCVHCQVNLPRQELALHVQNECARVRVSCPFQDVGCEEKVTRDHLQEHSAETSQRHLRLLAASHERLRKFVAQLAARLDASGPPRRISDIDPPPLLPPETPSPGPYGGTFPSPSCEAPGSLLLTAEGLMRELFQRNTQTEQRHREQEIKMTALRQRLADCETQAALLREREAASLARFCHGEYLWRVTDVNRLMQEAATAGHSPLVHSPGFYTSAFGYRMCLRLNLSMPLASPSRTPSADPYLSLFIHLMRGDHDDDLDWPFAGTITMSLLGRAPPDKDDTRGHHDVGATQHVTETMVSKPGLAAFERPHAERNPKGFGYTEFVALDATARVRHVRDGVLVVRALVVASDSFSAAHCDVDEA